MRVPHPRRGEGLELNMTPLIDVVFLLIVFFVVSSHLAKQETQFELQLPSATSSREPELDDARRIIINVLPDGSLLLGSQPIEREQLQGLLEDARQREQRGMEVRIRSDREVPYGEIEPILIACARAGIWKVTFAVLRKDETVGFDKSTRAGELATTLPRPITARAGS